MGPAGPGKPYDPYDGPYLAEPRRHSRKTQWALGTGRSAADAIEGHTSTQGGRNRASDEFMTKKFKEDTNVTVEKLHTNAARVVFKERLKA